MTATGEFVVDFIRVAEDYVDDITGQQVGPVALFGRDGVAWYWELETNWIHRGSPDQLTLTMTIDGKAP